MMNSIKTNRYNLLPVVLLLLLTACSTGIEGTKAIKMSRSERRELLPGAEERLARADSSRYPRPMEVGQEVCYFGQ